MCAKILFLKHIAIEGPGTMGSFFESAGFQIDIRNLYADDKVPHDVHQFAAVVSLGGPMNVYEEDQYSFLKEEDMLISKVVQGDIPFLGICLGAQLLAKACHARVIKSPAPEIGFSTVLLRPEGAEDQIFKNVGPSFKVFQWHEDMFEIAPHALWLSESSACPHQAFRIGKRAYGFQFHIEVDRIMILSWIKKYWEKEDAVDCQDAQNILSQYDNEQAKLGQVAERIYKNFASIIKNGS